MLLAARLLIPALWLIWALYWLVMARRVKAVAWRESSASRFLGVAPLLVAGWLLAMPRMPGWLGQRWVDLRWGPYWAGVLLVAASLALAVWARVELAGNWSGTVTLKQGHEIVRSGPYRWIRHPIYTGLLFAFLGSALALGEWRGLLAVVLVAVAFRWRIYQEELRLGQHFGAAYAQYRQGTWAIIPFLY
jgi:protein-S-isoprenylcysteine O-methyltransferase Ste14